MAAGRRCALFLVVALASAGACTPADERRAAPAPPSPSGPRLVRYLASYGDTRTGIVEVDVAGRSFCSEDHVPWAKGGHLHRRSRSPADDVVLTLFEPPDPNERTVCLDDVEADVLARIVADPESYYLDFHAADRGGRTVRARLGSRAPSFEGLEVDVPHPLFVRAGEIFEFPVAARDGEGRITGLLVRFGDGTTWGTLPFDLVCSATAGEKPKEGPSSREETIEHAYRRPGKYQAVVRVTSGGCFTAVETSRSEMTITVEGRARASNGPFQPKAKIGHAYYVNGNRRVLVSDIGGYDADGFVYWVRVDWGDGTRREVTRRGLRKCHAGRSWPEGWMSEPMRHRYSEQGEYEVVVKVRSTGCDGSDAQADTTRRVLEFPPVQGS